MRAAAAANRRAKRDVIVIDDDDSKNEQPTEKSARRETETLPSSGSLSARQETIDETVSFDAWRRHVYGMSPLERYYEARQSETAELRRKLLESDEKLVKSEQKFQRLCTMSGELQARVLFLENLIDTKQNIAGDTNKDSRIEELEKKLIDQTNQLEEERRGRMDDNERNRKRINYLEKQLEKEQKSGMKDCNRLNKFPNELDNLEISPSTDEIPRVERTGYSTNILEMCDANSCDTEWISFDNARAMLKASYDKCNKNSLNLCCPTWRKLKIYGCEWCEIRIFNVNSLFSHFFSEGHVKKALCSGRGLSLTTIRYWQETMEKANEIVLIHNECHPTIIFQLCRSDLPESISFDRAHDLLQSAFYKYEEYNKPNMSRVNKYVMDQALEFPSCEVCRFKCNKIQALCAHMFDKHHIKKTRSLGGNVSLAAVNYWIRKLEEADTAVGSGRMKDDSTVIAARLESTRQ